MQIFFVVNLASAYCVDTASEGDVKDQEGVGRHMGNNLRWYLWHGEQTKMIFVTWGTT